MWLSGAKHIQPLAALPGKAQAKRCHARQWSGEVQGAQLCSSPRQLFQRQPTFLLAFWNGTFMIRLWILATKMTECSHEYSLENSIWDWIELSNRKQKFRWIALNRHLAKREIIAVLNKLGITKSADFIALVCNAKTNNRTLTACIKQGHKRSL